MRSKLDTTYTLTIRPEYASLIPLVAQMNGWDGQGDSKEFLANFTNELIKKEMKLMIRVALDRYYGLSQIALIEQAMIDYNDSAELNSTWTEVE